MNDVIKCVSGIAKPRYRVTSVIHQSVLLSCRTILSLVCWLLNNKQANGEAYISGIAIPCLCVIIVIDPYCLPTL